MIDSSNMFKDTLLLAPMAVVTDTVYRKLCREYGADLVVTEMVSAEGLHYNSKKTEELFALSDWDRPCGVQLFGADPQKLGDAAKYVADSVSPAFIDLNSGCPVKKVVSKNGGSALLKDPILFGKIIEAMAKATDTPVTVKIRAGWNTGHWVEAEFGKIAQESGAQAIAIHPRSRAMGYSGEADWERIRVLKEAVDIPVIGNGDVTCGDDAVRMFKETGCDAIMIARGTYGNPWIFREIKETLAGKPVTQVTMQEKLSTARHHIALFSEHYGIEKPLGEMKKHLAWYFKGFPRAAELRNAVMRAQKVEDVEEVFKIAESIVL